jgi:hypothetical protein
MKRENGDVPSLPCCSPRLQERGLHTAIETLLGHCDSNFMPIALFPGRFTRMREIDYATRTDAQELEARSVKNNLSVRRNGGKSRGVPIAEPA